MSTRLYAKVVRNAAVTGYVFHVLCHFAVRANGRGEVRETTAKLCKAMRTDAKPLAKAVLALERKGYLRRVHARTVRRYFVVNELALSCVSRRSEAGELPSFFQRGVDLKKKPVQSARIGRSSGLGTKFGNSRFGGKTK